jgi:hypothetical protein
MKAGLFGEISTGEERVSDAQKAIELSKAQTK